MTINLPKRSARTPAKRADLVALDVGLDGKLRGTDSAGADVVIITPSGGVSSVAGRTGDVVLAKADVGLGNVDNTSDAAKPVSTAQAAADSAVQTAAAADATAKANAAQAAAQAASAPKGSVAASGLTASGPNKIVGRRTAGSGALEEFDIGDGLLVSPEGVLSAPGGGSNFGRTKLATTQSTASITYVDIPGLNFPAQAGKSYYFEFTIEASVNAATTGARFSVNGPAFSRLAYRTYATQAASGASAVIPTYSNAYDLPAASTTASPYVDGNLHIVSGVIKAAADGSVAARYAAESGSSGTVFANADTTFVTFYEIADVTAVSPTGSVVIRKDGATLGTATTIDFIGGAVTFAAGIATVTLGGGVGGSPEDALGIVIASADNTGATSANAGFTAAAYAACGLNASGVGTVKMPPRPIFLPAGLYDLSNWCPRDSAGHTLPVTWVAYPNSARVVNKLSPDSTTPSAGVNLDYVSWQEANRYQQLVSAVTMEFAPATFGVVYSQSNKEPSSVMLVPDASGYAPGQICHICCRDHLPHRNGQSTKPRIGETFRVLDVDYVANKVYSIGVLEWHDFYENDIYLTRMDERRTFKSWGVDFGGAVSTVGNSTGTPDTLDHGLFGITKQSLVSITKALVGADWVATATAANPHNLQLDQVAKVGGSDQLVFNIAAPVVEVVSSTVWKYLLRTKADADEGFGSTGRVAAASYGATLSASPITIDLTIAGPSGPPGRLYANAGQATTNGTTFAYTSKDDTHLYGATHVSGPTALAAASNTITQGLDQVANTATGTLVYQDGFAALEDATHNRCVNLKACVAPVIEQSDIKYPWMQVFGLNCTPEWLIAGITERGVPNAGTAAIEYDDGRIGYLLAVNGASCNGNWVGEKFVFDCRHPYTDGAGDVAFTPDQPGSAAGWTSLGLPVRNIIKGIVSRYCRGYAFDLHEHSRNTKFVDCWTIQPTRGHQGGSYAPGGWHIRAPKFSAINCGQDGGNYGIRQTSSEMLGDAARWSNDDTGDFKPLLFSITSITNVAGLLTIAVGAANNGVNNGAHLSPGDVFRLRSSMDNYNGYFVCATNDDATKTVTATMATRGILDGAFGVATSLVGGGATYPATGTTLTCSASINVANYPWRGQLQVPGVTGLVSYNGISGAGFQNCSGGTGTATPGGAITYAYAPASAPNPDAGVIAGMSLQPFAFTTHNVTNFVCENLNKGNGGAIWARAQTTRTWKSQWQVDSVSAKNVPSVILADDGARVSVGALKASQLRSDMSGSTDNAGAMVCVSGSGQVYVAQGILDCTDSLTNPAFASLENPGISPGKFLGNNGSIVFGSLAIKQHGQYMVCPRVFTFKTGALTGNKIGVGKLSYTDFGNVAGQFCITAPGEESKFAWIGGGEELYIPTQVSALTSSSVQVGQRGLGCRFLVRRASAVLDGNAVGTVTVDVRIGTTSIFGTNKVRVGPGVNLSTAGTQPTYLTSLLPDLSNLTLSAGSTSGSETAKLNGVSLSGFYI